MVSALLSAGCGLNRGDVSGASPLIRCVRQGHLETTRLMTTARHNLDLDLDLEWTDNERRTALIVAAQLNHEHVLQHLIDAGKAYIPLRDLVANRSEAGHCRPASLC